MSHLTAAAGNPALMTGPLPKGEIGYRGHDDVVLRGALYEVWNSICVSCGLPQKFTDTHIDHLIPRTVTGAGLLDLVRFHTLPTDFHIHRPANLALICQTCNTKKGNRLLKTLSMTLTLGTARSHATEVVRLVQEHVTARKVARWLTEAARADLSDPNTRREFEQHAPAITQTLALLDEDKADFLAERSFELDGYDVTVPLSLNARGRTAQAIIESVCGDTLTASLGDGLTRLLAELKEAVGARFHRKGSEDADWMPVETDRLDITLEFADFARRGDDLHVDFTGLVYAQFTATAAQSDDLGDGLVLLDAWAYQDGSFRLSLRWDLTESPDPQREVAVTFSSSYSDYSVTRA